MIVLYTINTMYMSDIMIIIINSVILPPKIEACGYALQNKLL